MNIKIALFSLSSLLLAAGFLHAQKQVYQSQFERSAVDDNKMKLNRDKEPKIDDSFKPLFNGKNLNGWHLATGTAKFFAKDGEIIGIGNNDKDVPNSFLATDKTYTNFILSLEFKWGEHLGNSGVMICAGIDGKGLVAGPQIEIETNPERAWTGGVYGERCGAWKYSLSRKEHDAARAAVSEFRDWNRLVIKCDNERILTWVNGVPCANLDWPQGAFNILDGGFIALQVHSGGASEIRFRNILIKELPVKSVFQKKFRKGAVADENMKLNSDKEPNLSAGGFKKIFDGKTLKGWRKVSGTAEWSVEDGAIKGVGNNDKNVFNSFLATEKNYKNFILTFKYKWGESLGNSGVMVRAALDEKVSAKERELKGDAVKGPQIEIETNPERAWTGGVYGERCGAWKYSLSRKEHDAARAAVSEFRDWNRMTIMCRGDSIKTWVNGIPCANLDWNNSWFDASNGGFIAFQVHAGGVSRIFIKDVKIKELR